MGNNLIGKCLLVNGQLIRITREYNEYPAYKNYYLHESITPVPKGNGIGYNLSAGVYYIGEDAKQVDSTVWDKTLKLIKLGNSACIAMLTNAPTDPISTGFKKLVYTYPNIVKVLSRNSSLLITPNHFTIIYNDSEVNRYLFLRNQVVTITLTANISKDIYQKVYNNIVNTTNEIKKLWTDVV